MVSSSPEASSILFFSSQGGHRRLATASLAAILSWLCLLVSLAVRIVLHGAGSSQRHELRDLAPDEGCTR